MKKILLAVFALLLALGSSMPVYALTQTTTIPVSVTVVPAVTVSATNLNFGTATPAATNTKGTASITVNVANGLPYTVTLDAGLSLSNGWRRVMSGATSGGSYGLYKDAAYNTEWGDFGLANTYTYGTGVAGTGTGANQTLTVYGNTVLSLSSTPGTYTDTVTVTVNY